MHAPGTRNYANLSLPGRTRTVETGAIFHNTKYRHHEILSRADATAFHFFTAGHFFQITNFFTKPHLKTARDQPEAVYS